jgi:hypothetical protein
VGQSLRLRTLTETLREGAEDVDDDLDVELANLAPSRRVVVEPLARPGRLNVAAAEGDAVAFRESDPLLREDEGGVLGDGLLEAAEALQCISRS